MSLTLFIEINIPTTRGARYPQLFNGGGLDIMITFNYIGFTVVLGYHHDNIGCIIYMPLCDSPRGGFCFIPRIINQLGLSSYEYSRLTVL